MKPDNTVDDRLHGIAAIIAAIPRSLWLTVIGLFLFFIGTALFLHRDAIPSFVDSVLAIAGYILDVVLGIVILRLAFMIYLKYHNVHMMSIKRSQAKASLNNTNLKNDLLSARVKERMYIPSLITQAIASGQNVEMEGLKVSNYLSNLHTLRPNGGMNMLNGPSLLLPAKSEMIAIARRHDFTPDNIFLAIGKGERDLVTSMEGYVHCANDGSTGMGKTANGRGQLTQFIKAGIDCYLLNPHFSPTTKKGEDWKPIAYELSRQATIDAGLPRVITSFPNIGRCLEWTANVEVDRRFEMMRQGDFSYKTLYLYIDEWPAIVTNCKNASNNLRTILQRGRAVEVCVFVNSQGFLQNDTDLQGSARENFDTTFFLGGSTYSGAKLLDMKEAVLKEQIATLTEPLGKGVAFMRNNTVTLNAEMVRLPLVTNDFVYYVLGHHDDYVLPSEVTLVSTESDHVRTTQDQECDLVRKACDQLIEQGDQISSRNIAAIIGCGKDKVLRLLDTMQDNDR